MTFNINDYFEEIKDNLIEVKTKIGPMAVYKNDTFVSLAITLYGEYCHAEVDILSRYLNEKSVYLDAGTNIGYQLRGVYLQTKCNCIGFEPHITHFTVAAYNCQNYPIKIFNSALGNGTGKTVISDFELDVNGNYGEVSESDEGIEATLSRIDDLKLSGLDALKIDVEGGELSVLKGGLKTIKKHRPVILFEANGDSYHKPQQLLSKLNYNFYWVSCRYCPVTVNFNGNMNNPFGRVGVSNLLAVPVEREQPDDLVPLVQGETHEQTVTRIEKYKLVF